MDDAIQDLNKYSWRVCRSFLQNHGITAPQTEGYTYFMDKLLPEIVQENSTIWVKSVERKRRDKIWFSGVTVLRPRYYEDDGSSHDITPSDALRKKTTYECEVRADVHHIIYYYEDEEMEETIVSQEEHKYRNIRLFFIPCMVRSRYCHWHDGVDIDPANVGGYFVIQGHEKSMIELQKMRTNFPVTRKITEDKTEAEIRSASGKWRSTSTIKFYAQTMSGGRVRLYVHIPFIMNGSSCIDVPLCAVFKVLRIETLEEMVSYIEPDESKSDFVKRALMDPCISRSRDDIIESIATNGAASCRDKNMRRNYVLHIFKSEFLPHCGVEGTQYRHEQTVTSHGRWGGKLRAHQRPMANDETIDNECRTKAFYIGFVVNRLLKIHTGILPEDDRDHYHNKRLDSPGPLLATILRLNFRGFLRQLPNALEKSANGFLDPISVIKNKASSLTNQMREPYKRGNWSMQPGINTGVVQQLARVNPLATMALGRRCMLTLNKQGKIAAPRQVHLSQEGILCPVETPEGQSCGLMLVLTLYSRISLGIPTVTMRRAIEVSFGFDSPCPLIEPIPVQPVDEFQVVVMVNGWPIGVTDRPKVLHESLLKMRRSMDLPHEMRIVWYQHNESLFRYFHINSDCSCVMRPLLRSDMVVEAVNIIKDKHIPIPALWKKLEQTGCIEYLDKEEESARKLIVAMRPNHLMRKSKRYTHLQIDENNILGCLASIIPYSDLNQSPRNMYFTSMCKAALALPSLDMNRLDMHSYHMWYPQRPLAATSFHDYMIEMSGGITTASVPIWCVMTLHGRNMEDSIYVNKASLDRGLFMLTYKRTFSSEARNKGTDEETFMIPPKTCLGRKARANYAKLQQSGKLKGIVSPGTKVVDGDVLIGKVARLPDQEFKGPNAPEVLQDRSVVMSKIGEGVVDKVEFDRRDGQQIVWVIVRCVRKPVVGDKFASFAAQKGTIGCILAQEDMPYSMATGMTPDVIMNPHAIPSRMTIGMVIEAIMGKAACFDGQRRNADSFKGVDLEDPKGVLKKYGFNELGKEKMMNGMTGEMIDAEIYMAPVSYMRLKHMVNDKIHSRSTGPKNQMTRQPTEGRSRNGGIRFGEMERDSMIAHGAAHCLRDRLCDNSDAFPVPFCRECGQIAEVKHSTRFGRGKINQNYCRFCDSCDNVVILTIPYASYLLIRELQAMSINMSVFVDEET